MDRENQISADTKLHCSFCGKSQDDVRKLIAGPKVYICDECVDLCNGILEREPDTAPGTSASPQPIATCALCKLPKDVAELRLVADKSALCVECIDAVRAVIDAADPNNAP
jgi:hypothetical protein